MSFFCLFFFLVFSYIYLRVVHNKTWLETLYLEMRAYQLWASLSGYLARVFYLFKVLSHEHFARLLKIPQNSYVQDSKIRYNIIYFIISLGYTFYFSTLSYLFLLAFWLFSYSENSYLTVRVKFLEGRIWQVGERVCFEADSWKADCQYSSGALRFLFPAPLTHGLQVSSSESLLWLQSRHEQVT